MINIAVNGGTANVNTGGQAQAPAAAAPAAPAADAPAPAAEAPDLQDPLTALQAIRGQFGPLTDAQDLEARLTLDRVGSPVAFDLNGDGEIGVTGETTARDGQRSELGRTVEFDLDADGQTEITEWLKGDGDGLLVDTTKIAADNSLNGEALFGDEGGKYSDGYAKLAQHDTNNDGQLTGQELDKLAVWQDDGDAVLEEGELKSLAEAGISQVSTQRNDILNDRGETLMRSTANNGEIVTEDVWFGQRG